MAISTRALQNAAVVLLGAGILTLLARTDVSGQVALPKNLPPRPQNLPLNNGSLQTNLPGNIATLPLFLRNGGFFGFGSGAFGQLQANPPAGGVILPPSMQLGGQGAGGGAGGLGGLLGGMGGCQGGGAIGIAIVGVMGGQQGNQNAFFPCSLQQGQFSGALVQRIIQDGFIVQYGVAMVPQVMGGIPTLATQMGSGFGGLKGNLFNAQQNQQNVNMNGAGGAGNFNGGVGGKIGLVGLGGAYGCY
jgi:hypothetical protein